MSEDPGTFRRYRDIKFSEDNLAALGRANAIIAEYRAAGYQLTLRQLYYQHVARGMIENTIKSYNWLGDLISDGRVAGLVDWEGIVDRTRGLAGLATYDAPEQMIRAARAGYRRDLWEDQPVRPEVWVEKEALADVVERVCNNLRVDFLACRGYVSQSELWRAGRRMAARVSRGQRSVVLHLGDHDPSGLDMTRDNRERLSLFAGVPVGVVRLALNMDQVIQYAPPPNPAKVTDARFAKYQAEHGDSSWELDALNPPVIAEIIRTAVAAFRDNKRWDAALRAEVDDLKWLDDVVAEAGVDDEE
jgi:hypothetical protein